MSPHLGMAASNTYVLHRDLRSRVMLLHLSCY